MVNVGNTDDCTSKSLERKAKSERKRIAIDATGNSWKVQVLTHTGKKKLKMAKECKMNTKECVNSLISENVDIESELSNLSRKQKLGSVGNISDTFIQDNDFLPHTLERKTKSKRSDTKDAAGSSSEAHLLTPGGKVKLKKARVHVLKIDDNTLSKYGYNLKGLKTNVSTALSDTIRNSSNTLIPGSDDTSKENTLDCLYDDKCHLKQSAYIPVSKIDPFYSSSKQNVLKTDQSPVANPRRKRKFDIPPNNRFSVGVINNFVNNSVNTKIPRISVAKIDDVVLSNHGISLEESLVTNSARNKIRRITASKILKKTSNKTFKENPHFSNISSSGKQFSVDCTVNVCRLEMDTLKKQNAEADVVNNTISEDYHKENVRVGSKTVLTKYPRVNLSRLDVQQHQI